MYHQLMVDEDDEPACTCADPGPRDDVIEYRDANRKMLFYVRKSCKKHGPKAFQVIKEWTEPEHSP